MKVDLDHCMAVARTREDALPWDLTLTISGKDYPVRRLSSEENAQLVAIVPETPLKEVHALLRSLLQLPEADVVSDEQAAAAMMGIAVAVGERIKLRQQYLMMAIRADAAEPQPQ